MAITLGGGLLGDLDSQLGVLQLGALDPALVLVPALPPTLGTPATETAVDFTQSQTFTWTASAPNAAAQTAYAFQRYPAAGGSAQWWNATAGTWQATETYNASASQQVVFPGGSWGPNGVDFGWLVATQNGSLAGPYASPNIVIGAPTPTVTVTGPSGTLTAGVITVTWSDSPSMTQVTWRAVVYTSAQHGAGGWTPGSSPSFADSTVTFGPANSWLVPPLLPPDTYTITVQATDSTGTTTAWAQGTVIVSYTAPTTPVVTAAWSSSTNTATITVTGTAGAPVLVQRSTDGGATYTAIRPQAGAPAGFSGTIGAGGTLTLTDAESFSGVVGGGALPLTVAFIASISGSSGTHVSSPSAASTVTSTVGAWSLAQTVPGGSAISMIVTDHQQTQAHRETAHKVLGNPDPIVIYDVTEAFTGTFKVWTGTQSAYRALIAMLADNQVLFLVSPYADILYVQMAPTGEETTITPSGAAAPYRMTTVAYVQVAEPAT